MIPASVASPVRVVGVPEPDPEIFGRILTYLVGPDVPAAVITDRTPIPARSELVQGLAGLREVRVLDRVRPNPAASDITSMARELAADRPGIVVGIGGGSTLDSAKGVALLLDGGGDLHDYLGPAPRRRTPERSTSLVLVPTTAGTGSEVTRFAVYTTDSGRKMTLNDSALLANAAILCPPLTFSMPLSLTAATGMDALSHALETAWNRNADERAVALGQDAATAVLSHIEQACRSAASGPESTAGRAEMLEAACSAGVAFNLTGTAAVHALSFVVSEEWHLPHGTACAFFLDDVLRINARDAVVRRRLQALASAAGLADADSDPVDLLAAKIGRLRRRFGMPSTFRDLGIDPDTEDLMARFRRAFDDPKMHNNPIPFDEPLLRELLIHKIRDAD